MASLLPVHAKHFREEEFQVNKCQSVEQHMIPSEIMVRIFSFLSDERLAIAATISREWHQQVKNYKEIEIITYKKFLLAIYKANDRLQNIQLNEVLVSSICTATLPISEMREVIINNLTKLSREEQNKLSVYAQSYLISKPIDNIFNAASLDSEIMAVKLLDNESRPVKLVALIKQLLPFRPKKACEVALELHKNLGSYSPFSFVNIFINLKRMPLLLDLIDRNWVEFAESQVLYYVTEHYSTSKGYRKSIDLMIKYKNKSRFCSILDNLDYCIKHKDKEYIYKIAAEINTDYNSILLEKANSKLSTFIKPQFCDPYEYELNFYPRKSKIEYLDEGLNTTLLLTDDCKDKLRLLEIISKNYIKEGAKDKAMEHLELYLKA